MIGGIGPWEIALIVIVLLVLFGAKKLPEIGQSLGKGLKEFKKATKEFTEPLKEDLYKNTTVSSYDEGNAKDTSAETIRAMNSDISSLGKEDNKDKTSS